MARPVDPNSKRSQRALAGRKQRLATIPQWIINNITRHAQGQPVESITWPTQGMAMSQRTRYYIERKILAAHEGPFQDAAQTALSMGIRLMCTGCHKDPRSCECGQDRPTLMAFQYLPQELIVQRQVKVSSDPSRHDHLEPSIGTGIHTPGLMEDKDNSEAAVEAWLGKTKLSEQSEKVEDGAGCSHEWDVYDVCLKCGRPKP